jgi:cobalt/nickel transport system permease protein
LQHIVLDRWARGSSAVHRFDPRAKLVALAALLIAVATANQRVPLFACEILVFVMAGFAWARVPVGRALLRAAVVLPLAGTFAAVMGLSGQAERGLVLALKSYVSALAVLLVVATTPLPSLLGGLEALGAPRFLLEVAQFLYRYLFLLSEEAQCMSQAAVARGLGANIGERFRAAAGTLAVLFARSYVRAEGIHRAMLARGFAGRFPLMKNNVPFAAAICTRAVFFEQGRIIAEGPVLEIAARFGWKFASEETASEAGDSAR